MELTRRRRRLRVAGGVLMFLGVLLAVLFPILRPDDVPGGPQTGEVAGGGPQLVTITGELAGVLAPGVAVPLNLSFDNDNPFPVLLEEVRVAVSGVDAPRAQRGRPCEATDYTIRQLLTDELLLIEADRAMDLRDLELAREHWPAVILSDRPDNQDGCQAATLLLTFDTTRVEVP